MVKIAQIVKFSRKDDPNAYFICGTINIPRKLVNQYRSYRKKGKKHDSNKLFVTGDENIGNSDITIEILASFPFTGRDHLNQQLSHFQSSFGK